jgi:predicted MFS family arabinose efflux permease
LPSCTHSSNTPPDQATCGLIVGTPYDLTDRRGAAFTVGLGSVLTAAAFLLFAVAGSSLAVLGLGVVVLDIGIQAGINGNQSTILGLAPQATNRTNTIYMVFYFVGGALGSSTAGLAWHHFRLVRREHPRARL